MNDEQSRSERAGRRAAYYAGQDARVSGGGRNPYQSPYPTEWARGYDAEDRALRTGGERVEERVGVG
jgi:hypothetical protein